MGFIMEQDTADNRTLGQRIMSGSLWITGALGASLLLGVAMEKGNEKADEGLRERITEQQQEMVDFAIDTDNCGMLRSSASVDFSGYCFREQRAQEAEFDDVGFVDDGPAL